MAIGAVTRDGYLELRAAVFAGRRLDRYHLGAHGAFLGVVVHIFLL
jgi:hypothetical protein